MSTPSYTPITTRNAFQEALRSIFSSRQTLSCREIIFSDLDFADWPLSQPEVIAALSGWAAPQRKLTLLAGHFEAFPRHHARWITWRKPWSHIVHCQAANEADLTQLPTQLLIPGKLVLRLVERQSFRGGISLALIDVAQAQDSLVAILQRSQSAFPATTLGL